VTLTREDFRSAVRFMTYQLEREIALQAWGDEGAFQQIKSTDPQLSRAIELLELADTPEAVFRIAEDYGAQQGRVGTGASSPGATGAN